MQTRRSKAKPKPAIKARNVMQNEPEDAQEQESSQKEQQTQEGDSQAQERPSWETTGQGNPAGAQNIQSPAQPLGAVAGSPPKPKPAPALGQSAQFVAFLAAVIFTKSTVHTTKDAYQYAKNLVQAIADEEESAAAAEEPENEQAA